MSLHRGETIEMLHGLYANLRSSGERGLSDAYKFGQLVVALNSTFTYADLAHELGVTPPTIGKYAKLARKYSTEHRLLATARAMDSWDVSKLNSDDAGVPVRSVLECRVCGSHDVAHKREKVTVPDTPAELLRQS